MKIILNTDEETNFKFLGLEVGYLNIFVDDVFFIQKSKYKIHKLNKIITRQNKIIINR